MSNELANKETKFNVNDNEITLTPTIVYNQLAKGNEKVSMGEITMFIELCKCQKLNPFLNEAYLVKFKGKPAQMIVSKEAYMKKAERNSEFEGFKAGLILLRDKEIIEVEGAFKLDTDTLLGGWCEVHKKGRKFPYIAKVPFKEYNKGQSTWASMPNTMIRKTAIVQALRDAFPEDLGNMYIEEEQQDFETTVSVKDEIKENANKELLDIDVVEEVKEEGEPAF